MKCECGNDTFLAHQLCRVDIIVDENNNFVDGGSNLDVYDSETPYGPYICTRCGKEYDELAS